MNRPFNLQLFAEVEPTGEPTGDVGAGDAGQGDAEVKEKDPAKAFAARLGHEKKKIEAEYTPYKSVLERQAKAAGMDVKEYIQYQQEQLEREELEAEAQARGKTPEQIKLEREKAEKEAELAKYQRKEKLTSEEKELTADPKIGKFVTDNLSKIREIADAAEVDLRTALAIVATEKLPELLEQTNPDIHIKNYLESLKKGGKPIEIGGGIATPQPVAPKTFDDARKSALERLRRSE